MLIRSENKAVRSISLALAVIWGVAPLGHCLAQPAAVPAVVLTVRGTVEAIDARRTEFVLRVQTHTRTIYLTEYTDTTGLGVSSSAPFPVHLQERVTVAGSLQPDGAVLAGLVTAGIQHEYQPVPGTPDRILFGTVSATSSKLRGRDIKVRSADGLETKVKVGRGLPITKAGRGISVHALGTHDEVRVVGTLAGTDFQAARIDVLPPAVIAPPTAAPTALPADVPEHTPTQPGL